MMQRAGTPHPSQTRFTMEDGGWLPVAKLPLLMVPRKNVELGLCWSGFLFFFFLSSSSSSSSFSFAGSWMGGHKKGQPYGCPFLWLWGKRMGKRSDRMLVGLYPVHRDAARQNSPGECVITSGTSDCMRCKKIAKAGQVPAFFVSPVVVWGMAGLACAGA